MDQQLELQCMRVDHNELITGICVSESCEAPTRILCIKCLETVHANCKMQSHQKQDFLKRLNELKQVQESKEISGLKETSSKLFKSIKSLQSCINDFIAQYDKSNVDNQIDQILKKQYLSANDWLDGYKLLNDKPIDHTRIVEQLKAELHQIQQTIDKITSMHSKQDVSLINDQVVTQQLVKSDCNNITPQKPLIIEAKHSIRTIALSPDGEYVASAGEVDYSIRIWNPITGKQVGNDMKGHTEQLNSINYSKCGKYIVSGSSDKTIRRWNVQSQQQIDLPMNGHENTVRGVQYTPDQRYIVSCSRDTTIRLWSPETGKEHLNKRIQHENSILCMSLSPISNDVVIGDIEGMIKIYNYERHQLSGPSLNGHTECICVLQYSEDGQYIVSGGDDNAIILWNAITRQWIASLLSHEQGYYYSMLSVSFSPDTRYIISGGADKKVRIWDRVNGKQIGEPLTYHTKAVCSTQFSLDGKYIITGGEDEQLRIMVAPMGQ